MHDQSKASVQALVERGWGLTAPTQQNELQGNVWASQSGHPKGQAILCRL